MIDTNKQKKVNYIIKLIKKFIVIMKTKMIKIFKIIKLIFISKNTIICNKKDTSIWINNKIKMKFRNSSQTKKYSQEPWINLNNFSTSRNNFKNLINKNRLDFKIFRNTIKFYHRIKAYIILNIIKYKTSQIKNLKS